MYEKICQRCGKKFESIVPHKKYCSPNCKVSKEKVCIVCGNTFQTTDSKRKYCSDVCAKEGWKRNMKQVSSDFLLKKTIEEHQNPEYRLIDQNLLEDEVFDSNSSMRSFKCDECGTVFYSRLAVYPEVDMDGTSYTKIDSINATEWGAPYCPKCGLVHSTKTVSAYDEVDQRREAELERTRIIMSKEEYYHRYSSIYDAPKQKTYKKQPKQGSMRYVKIRKGVGVFVKKQAQYFEDDERVYDEIDFIREGEVIANMRKRRLTDDDYSTLISATFRQFR